MKFFDPKEEVLDVQITKYGRQLLSQGTWKPTYYAFFDDNVVYDSQYIGISENKSSAETRIQDETPALRTQAMFHGLDEYLFDGVNDIIDQDRLGTYERLNVMPLSLGTSDLNSTKTPAFRIRFLQGDIKSVSTNSTGSIRTSNTGSGTGTHYSQQLIKIPQIDLDIEYKITATTRGESVRFEEDPALTPQRVYSDNAEVKIGPAQLLMIVEERNATFDYKNFDIEVYEITDQIGPFGEKVLEPLSFRKPLVMVENNLLLDKEEAEAKAGQIGGKLPPLDPSYVEYYFNVNVDSEIDENLLCKSIASLRSTDLFNDLEIVCPDLLEPITNDIYASDADDEDCPDY